jgi:ribonuclease HI
LQSKRRTIWVHLAWVPGHENIAGNKMVDKHVKEAAERQWSPTMALLSKLQCWLPASIAAIKVFRKTTMIKR